MICQFCEVAMIEGQAIGNTFTSLPDFPGDVRGITLHFAGPGILIDCLKCPQCGWSVTKPEERT